MKYPYTETRIRLKFPVYQVKYASQISSKTNCLFELRRQCFIGTIASLKYSLTYYFDLHAGL